MMAQAEGKRCRLLHVLHHDGQGGGPTCVSELLDIFAGAYDQAVITGGKGPLSAFCAQRGIPCHHVGLHRLLLVPVALFRIARLLRRLRASALILTGQWAGLAVAPLARLLGQRNTIYVVQFSFLYTDWDLYRVARNYLIEWLSCRFASRVIFLSPGNRYQYMIRGMLPRAKMRLIPNAFNPARVPPKERAGEIRARFGWQADLCHVACVGRLEDQKRVDWLIKSWAIVEKKAPSARLWIVGSDKQEQAMRSLAAELGLRHCTFLGSQAAGIDFVAASDIVAMTSLFEMHAITPLEAMGCGKPIVASDADGVRFTFSSGTEGLMVQPGDIEAFSDALLTLINDPSLRRRMGDAGRRRVELFSPARSRESYGKLFAELGISPQ